MPESKHLHNYPDFHFNCAGDCNDSSYVLLEKRRKPSQPQFLDLKDAKAYSNRACAYSLKFGRDKDEEDSKKAVADLKMAIQLDPVWKEMAKTDADFDLIPTSYLSVSF